MEDPHPGPWRPALPARPSVADRTSWLAPATLVAAAATLLLLFAGFVEAAEAEDDQVVLTTWGLAGIAAGASALFALGVVAVLARRSAGSPIGATRTATAVIALLSALTAVGATLLIFATYVWSG